MCRLRLGTGPRLVRELTACRSQCQFLGCQFLERATRPRVVIIIAVRHEHHLAPDLLNRTPSSSRKSPTTTTTPPPSTSNLPRTTMGKTKRRRISQEMSTIWRIDLDRLRASIAEMEGSESEEEEGCDQVKRKRAPPRGAVRARGEVGRMQGVRCLSTCRGALGARSAVGLDSVSTVVSARCRVPWAQSASTVVSALVQGVWWGSICQHGRQRCTARSGGSQICEHDRIRSRCKECRESDQLNRDVARHRTDSGPTTSWAESCPRRALTYYPLA